MINQSFIDPSAIGQSLRALANRVDDKGGDVDSADRLRSLSEAVEKKNNASSQAWASSDISKVIDPDSIVEHYGQRHATVPGCLLEIIEAARNVFIFAPIIVTWMGISQASAKYNDIISDALTRHDTVLLSQPFLYLWQQGFGGRLPGILTLSSIATIDVIILLFIFLLTVLAHIISNQNRLREENNARKLYSDLVHAIGRATLCLHMKNQTQLQLVGGPINQLDQVAQDIRDMANKIMANFSKLESDLGSQFQRISDDLSAQLQQGKQYLATLGATASTLQPLAQEMRDAAQDLADANEKMTESVDKLLTPATSLAQQQQKLLQAVEKSVALLQTNADSLQDVARQQASMGNDLVVSLDAVRPAFEKMDELVIHMGGFVSQQSNLVTEMGNEHAAQTRLADSMMQTMMSTQNISKELQTMAIDFRQIAVDTNEVLTLYAKVPKTVGSDMARAVQLIENGSSVLNDAAMSIYSASQFFEQVVTDFEKAVATM